MHALIDNRELEQIISDMERGFGSQGWEVRLAVTDGPSRSAAENMKVWKLQAAYGRDPFHYDEREAAQIVDLGIGSFIEGSQSALPAMAAQLSDFFHRSVQRNIDAQIGIRPNRGRYARLKAMRGLPPLEYTGELRHALRGAIARKD